MKLGISFTTVQVVFLLALQVCAIAVLWSLNALSQADTNAFVLFLSIDILAFVLTSYMYRSLKNEAYPNESWMSAGYLALAFLVVSVLIVV